MSLTAPNKIAVPWANTGVNRTSIPTASQISITPGAASWTDGFPPITMTPIASGGIPPAGPDFNGVLYSLSQSLQWLQSGSGYAFDGTFSTAVGGYPQRAQVQRSDGQGYWLNTVANNTTDPESSTSSGWLPAASNASTAITMTSSNVTMTALQAGAYIITLSGALTANLNLIFPTWAQEWLVVNNCSGSYSVTCKTAAGAGVAIAAGANAIIYGDGTNIIGMTPSIITPGLFAISTGTVASNALTIGYPAQTIAFRNSTLTSGTPSIIAATAGSLTIPSGATLGTVSGQQAILMQLALNVSGTVVPAVVNLAGGVDLSETGLISTTAISSGATSASVVYSAAAQTNVPYRVIGAYYVTEATAGTWATAPNQAIGVGGESFSALMSAGYGQTLQNVTGSRAVSTTYYNTTPRPIKVRVTGGSSPTVSSSFSLNGTVVQTFTGTGTSGSGTVTFFEEIPPDWSYSFSFAGSMTSCFETR